MLYNYAFYYSWKFAMKFKCIYFLWTKKKEKEGRGKDEKCPQEIRNFFLSCQQTIKKEFTA